MVRGLRLVGKLASVDSSSSDLESASGSESVAMISVSSVCSASERASSGVGAREFNFDGCRESVKISRAGKVSAEVWGSGKWSDETEMAWFSSSSESEARALVRNADGPRRSGPLFVVGVAAGILVGVPMGVEWMIVGGSSAFGSKILSQ